MSYSTVTEYRCSGYLFPADTFFCFTITIRRPILQMPHYTEYQYFLYETILKLRNKGMTFTQIADHLNKKNILSDTGIQTVPTMCDVSATFVDVRSFDCIYSRCAFR